MATRRADVSVTGMRACCAGIAIAGVLVGCSARPTAVATTPPAPSPVPRATDTVATSQAARPRSANVTQTCPGATSVAVTTENRTGAKGDLCAAPLHALAKLPYLPTLGMASFKLNVTLTLLTIEPVACSVSVVLSTRAKVLGIARGEVHEPTGSPLSARGCVDVVVEDLVTSKVGPLMQTHAASLPGLSNTGTGANPTSPAPTSAQPSPQVP